MAPEPPAAAWPGLALGLGALVAGATLVSAGSTGEHADEVAGGHGSRLPRDYASLWKEASPEEQAAATKLVEDTKAATSRYRDFREAAAAGYRPNPGSSRDETTHYPDPSLLRDGIVLDPDAPETLVYWTAPDGSKVLVGVVYKAAPGEQAPAPGGQLTMGHTHAAGEKCYPASDPDCPDSTVRMLHVFIFEGVQDPFADTMVAAAGGRQAFARAMRR